MLMKLLTAENGNAVDESAEGPVVSFAHLSSCLASEADANDQQNTSFGFPASEEASLYETGFLLKAFLKC